MAKSVAIKTVDFFMPLVLHFPFHKSSMQFAFLRAVRRVDFVAVLSNVRDERRVWPFPCCEYLREALHGLEHEFQRIWEGVTDDEKWHDVYFHGEEALFYYLGALRENGSLPKEFIPRWVFVAFAVRDAILHGAGDVEFVEDPVMHLRSASKDHLWPNAIQEIDNCLGWFGTSPA